MGYAALFGFCTFRSAGKASPKIFIFRENYFVIFVIKTRDIVDKKNRLLYNNSVDVIRINDNDIEGL